jgi:hypothetical protein
MSPPLVLFGAFDRHNLGDLLFAHVALALHPRRETLVCGLADRDLRPVGGHLVQSVHRLHAEGCLRGATLLHAGGEILTCTARQAAVMLTRPDEADGVLAMLEAEPERADAWRRAMLGTDAAMPYVASRRELPDLARVVFAPAGGVALDALDAEDHDVVIQRLFASEQLAVRDVRTRNALRAAGLAPALAPDPVVMIEALFGDVIRARAGTGPVADCRRNAPDGYVALQLAAEFADDASLDRVAAQVGAVLAEAGPGIGLVLFRAGTAPWHDDAGLPTRFAARIGASGVPNPSRLFPSVHVLDLCALLASARAVVSSSLHAGIVATAFGVPWVGVGVGVDVGANAEVGAEPASKLATWAGTCELAWNDAPASASGVQVVAPGAVDDALRGALALDPTSVRRQATRRAEAARRHAERLDAFLADRDA